MMLSCDFKMPDPQQIHSPDRVKRFAFLGQEYTNREQVATGFWCHGLARNSLSFRRLIPVLPKNRLGVDCRGSRGGRVHEK
jgi:hypothetical protein